MTMRNMADFSLLKMLMLTILLLGFLPQNSTAQETLTYTEIVTALKDFMTVAQIERNGEVLQYMFGMKDNNPLDPKAKVKYTPDTLMPILNFQILKASAKEPLFRIEKGGELVAAVPFGKFLESIHNTQVLMAVANSSVLQDFHEKHTFTYSDYIEQLIKGVAKHRKTEEKEVESGKTPQHIQDAMEVAFLVIKEVAKRAEPEFIPNNLYDKHGLHVEVIENVKRLIDKLAAADKYLINFGVPLATLEFWFSEPYSVLYPEVFAHLVKRSRDIHPRQLRSLIYNVAQRAHWKDELSKYFGFKVMNRIFGENAETMDVSDMKLYMGIMANEEWVNEALKKHKKEFLELLKKLVYKCSDTKSEKHLATIFSFDSMLKLKETYSLSSTASQGFYNAEPYVKIFLPAAIRANHHPEEISNAIEEIYYGDTYHGTRTLFFRTILSKVKAIDYPGAVKVVKNALVNSGRVPVVKKYIYSKKTWVAYLRPTLCAMLFKTGK